ncbi:hypothetical protein [Catenovulum sediminis]|uniref:Lipoprotein n=1 Tax=Catenovulum sediminis TaxID=1740262 RepID=A0ABV1RK93_9ALTE
MNRFLCLLPLTFIVLLGLTGCEPADQKNSEQTQITQMLEAALGKQTFARAKTMYNEAAYIPPQCYTKTQDESGQGHNPCFVCHANGKRPNFFNDTDLQLEYGFTAEYTQTNRWKNLFRDFSPQISKISDQQIRDYVKVSNYLDKNGEIILARQLQQLPEQWDVNKDGKWNGFMPDVYFNFDELGFDRNLQGEFTGWRVFAYAPFAGAFFPTNGSTDDVLIRLPEAFRKNEQGEFDQNVYRLNLAIVESMIKEQAIDISAVDEQQYQVDLNKDGQLNIATQIVYDWAPKENKLMSYVGQARLLFQQDKINMAAGLYPKGTEFLHTVRYLDSNERGETQMSARIKEVRYSKKISWNNYAQLSNYALSEIKEKHDFPERLRTFKGDSERGLYSGMGWKLQGFIEDAQGQLRPQTYEETAFCIGCHSGTSATTDGSFALPRKFANNHFKNGWYHWSEKGFKGTPEPKMADGRYEYTTYLQHNRWGDEFRSNQQVYDKFYTQDGVLNQQAITELNRDISILLEPDLQRAMALNKAYKVIVEEQSYIWGRQAMLEPAVNVHEFVKTGTPTGLNAVLR